MLEWSMRVNGPPMVNFEKEKRPLAEKMKTSNGVRKRVDNRITVPYIGRWLLFPSSFLSSRRLINPRGRPSSGRHVNGSSSCRLSYLIR
ncbi:hypothetical protein M514_22619 [Trichuris suis]|uniref:Uncharacterized protein n=1 Tax=Trichuris suis TaxID=68888 RepID=A0A085N6Z3_9BILA|nr:hypothetical protein M514_22619 [Trichuris suis]